MLYLLWSVAVAAGLVGATLVREIGTEYVANFVAENDASSLGASTRTIADGSAAAAAGSPQPAAVAPNAEPIQRILIAGSATPEALPPLKTSEMAKGSIVPAAAPAPLAAALAPPAAAPAASAPLVAAPPATTPAPSAALASTSAATPGPDQRWLLKALQPTEEPPTASFDDAAAQAVLSVVRDTPYRRPDGMVFIPITTQRLFAVRSMVTREASVPITFDVPGRIINSPTAANVVQASRPGIIESIDGQFPFLGKVVQRGDLLAYLRPTIGVVDRAQIEAQIQHLANEISLARKQIARLEEVFFVRYRANKIQALEVAIEGDRRQLATLQQALDQRQEIRANADGVISQVAVSGGAAVDQNQLLFGIVDPKDLWVEAAAHDPNAAGDIRDAAGLTTDGRAIVLKFVGGGLTLANLALPLDFRIVGETDGLTVGQPLSVVIRSSREVRGIPIPASCVVRDTEGRNVVWERRSAEIFIPRLVQLRRVAGDMVVVEAGLSNGLRIVTRGAAMIDQVR